MDSRINIFKEKKNKFHALERINKKLQDIGDTMKIPEFLFTTRNQKFNQEIQEKQATLQESHDPNTKPTKLWQNMELVVQKGDIFDPEAGSLLF